MCRKLLLLIAGLAARRAECVRSEGEARQACYYRLRISQWDYQAARKILIDQREQKRINAYAVQ